MLASVTGQAAYGIRRLQNGSIQSYVYVYLVGALALAVITMVCVLI